MKLGVIGNGFVGKASRNLENPEVQVLSYDLNPALCIPIGTTFDDIANCDVVFVSVPTPMNEDGSVHINIVEKVVRQLQKAGVKDIVIRSTVPPGTSSRLNVHFIPEFLTERNFMNDFIATDPWIMGAMNDNEEFKNKMRFIMNKSVEYGNIKSSNIEWVSNTEGEMIKYFRNTFLAVKVSFCNEIYEFCQTKNIDYEKIRSIAARDQRIGLSHTLVPGLDGKMGYGGTCFPKDINGLNCEYKKAGLTSFILDSAIRRNEQIDRKEKDWANDKGRATI